LQIKDNGKNLLGVLNESIKKIRYQRALSDLIGSFFHFFEMQKFIPEKKKNLGNIKNYSWMKRVLTYNLQENILPFFFGLLDLIIMKKRS